MSGHKGQRFHDFPLKLHKPTDYPIRVRLPRANAQSNDNEELKCTGKVADFTCSTQNSTAQDIKASSIVATDAQQPL